MIEDYFRRSPRISAANNDDYALGTIEYGLEHLGLRLIVVLRRECCGAR